MNVDLKQNISNFNKNKNSVMSSIETNSRHSNATKKTKILSEQSRITNSSK